MIKLPNSVLLIVTLQHITLRLDNILVKIKMNVTRVILLLSTQNTIFVNSYTIAVCKQLSCRQHVTVRTLRYVGYHAQISFT
jgi:hypothetical protein